jgi:hypothetical protein
MQNRKNETPMTAAPAISGNENTPVPQHSSFNNLYVFPKANRTESVAEEAVTESVPGEFSDPKTTDLIPGETGPSGFPVSYNSQGDKVELWDDDERPGEIFEVIVRRNDDAIGEAINEFFDKVWYNRKFDMFNNILRGLEEPLSTDIHAAVMKAMRDVEGRYGKDDLGPWDDFEWGMINGKLSALRWVMGEEWDMLDT